MEWKQHNLARVLSSAAEGLPLPVQDTVRGLERTWTLSLTFTRIQWQDSRRGTLTGRRSLTKKEAVRTVL